VISSITGLSPASTLGSSSALPSAISLADSSRAKSFDFIEARNG
jgi:hypothetical protein